MKIYQYDELFQVENDNKENLEDLYNHSLIHNLLNINECLRK